jgi:hypothetical protein
MSGIQNIEAAREMLRDVARVVKYTRQTLAVLVQQDYRPGRPQSKSSRPGRLADALEHLGDVREGFILSQRTPQQVSLSDLRALLEHALLDWGWINDLNLIFEPGTEIESPSQQLLAYNHALVALATLPRLPAEAVTFPQQRPTYADVSAPVLPAEMLERIEEIERIIYQAEVTPSQRLAYDPLRRTYAFFEASSWLVDNYLEPLLGGL